MAPPLVKPIPVVLITGFLGSGKTTLLSHWLADPQCADSAVIVNEFGEIAIDHLVVADLAENIVELRDGCLCCTIRGDLALTLRDLHHKRVLEEIPSFARVIVETSGLADPVPLIHTLMLNRSLRQAFGLDAVVTVVDGRHGTSTLATHATARSQVMLADSVLVSKVDEVDRGTLDGLLAEVRRLNPGAEIIEMTWGRVAPRRIVDRGLFEPPTDGKGLRGWLDAGREDIDSHAGCAAHVIRWPGPLSLAGTSVFLNRLANEFSEKILRIKGLSGFRERGGRPALVHAVQGRFYPLEWLASWPDADTSSRFVFIGADLDTARIDELFHALCV